MNYLLIYGFRNYKNHNQHFLNMETKIIFALKDNWGNLRGVSDKEFIEKEEHPIKTHLNS
jgi:hypothetical protein